MAENQKDQPTWKSPAYLEMEKRWQRCRDIRAGTDVIREKKHAYLPRFVAEDGRDWDARVNMTVVVDFFEQAVTTFVGMGLRTDPELGKEVPEEIQEDWENLDGEGNHGAVVAQHALDAALTDGHCVLLAESPEFPLGLRGDEQLDRGIRPYMVIIKINQICSWRAEVKGGEKILMQFVFEEPVEAADGEFGAKTLSRYRRFRQQFPMVKRPSGQVEEDLAAGFVEWELWEETTRGSYSKIKSGVLAGVTRIPAWPVYGGKREGILKSRPPLDGLAHSNIRWAQVMSERASSLNRCGMPIPVILGDLIAQPGPDGKPSADIVLSSTRGVHLKTGGDFKFAEATGTALEQTRLELQDWEKRMGAQSLAMLQRDTEAAETATAHRMNRGREESKLRRALRSLEDALEGVLQDMARYRGLDPETIDITLNRDIGGVVPPEVLTLLSSLEEKGQLTLTRLLLEIKRAGLVGNDFDPEAEVKKVRQEMGTEPLTEEGEEAEPAVSPEGEPTTKGASQQIQTTEALVLNGAQITAAKDIVLAVAAGELPRDSGVKILQSFFNLKPGKAEEIMASAGTGEPTTPNPQPTPEGQPSEQAA